MKLHNIITLTLAFCVTTLFSQDIFLHFAQSHDIPAILQFERDVTHEYFVPLLNTHYKHLPAFADPNALQNFDDGWFSYFVTVIENATNETDNKAQHVLIAIRNDYVIGVCAFEKQENSLYINYLAVSEQARRNGIGTMLLDTALATYNDIDLCTLETFAFGNDSTLAFYDRYGFTNTQQLCTLDERFPDMLYLLKLELNK
jgi:ribosomal protein S18 acetylase RimI-like enzyme